MQCYCSLNNVISTAIYKTDKLFLCLFTFQFEIDHQMCWMTTQTSCLRCYSYTVNSSFLVSCTYRVAHKKTGPLCVTLVTLEILIRLAPNLTQINVISSLTLICKLYETILENKWRYFANDNNP